MDTACFATLKSTPPLAKVSKGGFFNGEDGINQLAKRLKLDDRRKQKFKPGVAFANITTEIGKDTVVSSPFSIHWSCYNENRKILKIEEAFRVGIIFFFIYK